MLVLTRKAGESIIVANNIRVKIIEVTPGGVKIGIEAPRDVSIFRAELYQEVEGVNRQSLSDGPLPEGLVSGLRKKAALPESGAPAEETPKAAADPESGDDDSSDTHR
jgi:carbon storage regulator